MFEQDTARLYLVLTARIELAAKAAAEAEDELRELVDQQNRLRTNIVDQIDSTDRNGAWVVDGHIFTLESPLMSGGRLMVKKVQP